MTRRISASTAPRPCCPAADTEVSDSQISWDLSALYKVNDWFNVYGRVADGFRAPTIQGRDIAFFGHAVGRQVRNDHLGRDRASSRELAGNRVRLNGAVFYYEIKDQQLSAIGGGGNFIQLVNADKGTGMGFDLEGEFRPPTTSSSRWAYSYVDTEIDDPTSSVPPCGSGSAP